MKILYGVQGTGNGHISRARMMAKYFKQHNADVTFLFSGRKKSDYFNMECFGKPIYLRGLTFFTEQGEINQFKTALNNNLLLFLSDAAKLDINQYDLVITDFEPITAWAGRLSNRKVIGIGHQYAFCHDIPTTGSNIITRNIMRYFAPADISIGLHWHHFGHTILPPIIDKSLKKNKTTQKNILVYLPFENQPYITHLLHQLPDYTFTQYSPDLNDQESLNVSLRKTCLEGFKKDLASTAAVICNAGFELVSECLELHKPVLVKPLKGQMEQLSNAVALEKLKFGSSMSNFNTQDIDNWLDNLPATPNVQYPDVAKVLVDWVLSGDHSNPDSLLYPLWQKTN